MKTMNAVLIASIALAMSLAGCATTAPAQLVNARAAYETSSRGPAAKLTPTDLYDAKKALDTANKEFAEHGASPACSDYAYVAQRKVELADAKARTEEDHLKIVAAEKAGVVVRDSQVKATQAALDAAREELKDERRDSATKDLRAANDAQGKELARTSAELDSEKQGRLSAESKLNGALQDLAAISAVKEDARGVVITLSGSVLFASGRYALLNTAMTRLDQVAEALKAQDSDRRMVVEGHTDSKGSDATNQRLSLNRATSVRDYLVSRGVVADRISATGLGSTRPVADNVTAESRANNRRVEIVIGSPTFSAR